MKEANLVGMAPWLIGKSPGHRDGPPKPVIESRPAKRNATIKVPPRSLTELQTWMVALAWTQNLQRSSSLVAEQVLRV